MDESGTDSLEIHTDAIQKGDWIPIHDEVLATGGTAQAVCELVQLNFLMEISFLKGRDRIKEYEIFTALTY